MEILIPVGILVAWIILQAWILPHFGVKTCLGGACGPSSAPTRTNEQKHPDKAGVSTDRDLINERKSP